MIHMTKVKQIKTNIVADYGLLNVAEAAEYLKVSLSTFRTQVAPELQPIDIPTREHFFTLQQLRDYVERKIKETAMSEPVPANVPAGW